MTQTASPLLRIKGLHIEGESNGVWHEIVRGIDLTLNRGEVLGLIGESGAGKSTLGLAAMGYTKPGCRLTAGSIHFDGQDLARADTRSLRDLWGRRIAYVAQSAAAAFNPAHRLIEQVIEVPVVHRTSLSPAAREDAVTLFRDLQLPDPERIGRRFPHQVSGGQLQRAMTAMAMTCRPDLIIFDEPTTALDVSTQIEVMAAIRSVVREFGTAAIYITHDLAVVTQMADRLMVLRHGELVEEAPTAEMIATPRQSYTRSLWAVQALHKPERPSDGRTLLEVDHLGARYGSFRVLDDVSFSVPEGRTVALVGESGSGKSSLARVLTGLLAPCDGQIRYDGRPLPARFQDRDRSLLREIQMIYQLPDTALNPRHRIGDIIGQQVTLHLGLRGAARERRVRDLFEMIELSPHLANRLPSELSGGQKQRVCIARALAAEPRLIICDEVTSALDQLVAEGILKLLMRLQAEVGVSYLYITHDIATVDAVADTVVVMQQGRIVEQGTKGDVLSAPRDSYTCRLLSSVPRIEVGWLDAVLSGRSGSGPRAKADDGTVWSSAWLPPAP